MFVATVHRMMSVSRGSNNARVSLFIAASFYIVASYYHVSTFDLHRGPPQPRPLRWPQPYWTKSLPLLSLSPSSSSLERTIEGDDPQPRLENNDKNKNNNNDNEQLRRIPFEQRVTQPRLARRMNHPFKYLFRHGFDEAMKIHSSSNKDNYNCNASALDMDDPYTFLYAYGNYSHEQIQQMNASFPMLLQLSVRQQLYPKLLFLKYTILQQQQQQQQQQQTPLDPAVMSALVPPHYFGARLERILAPRHAFLVWTRQLPCGVELLSPVIRTNPPPSLDHSTTTMIHSPVRYKFHEFLWSCRNSKQFAVTCQKWSLESGHSVTTTRDHTTTTTTKVNITAKDIEAFDMIFGRGLLSICRNDLVQDNNTWAIDQLQQNYKVRAADLVPILIGHGSNVYERDHRGATLLHWACGTGHIDIVQQLVPYFDVTNTTTTRDGATVLHWSAAGCNTREFGIGGHVDICEYLIDCTRTPSSSSSSSSSLTVHKFINQCTYDGNSPLMWAAWSGTLDTVKLLVRNKADTTLRNRNGCSVAHWAASGGNIEVCRYLHSIANVDFTVTNYGGNSPLSHAVAFGRTNVVEWLLQIVHVQTQDKMLLYTLAQDFVQWTDGEEKQRRSELLQQLVDR